MKEELNSAGMLQKKGGGLQRRPLQRERGIIKGKTSCDECQTAAGSVIDNGQYHALVGSQEYGVCDETGRYTEVCDGSDTRTELHTLPEEPSVDGYVVCTLADSLRFLGVEELEALQNGNTRQKK